MIHRKARSLMSAPEAIATVAAAALSQAASQQTGPTGSTVTHNADGTKTITGPVLGTDATGTSVTTATHVGDTTPPGVPTGISATSTSGMLTVRWDGTLTGGVPGDFSHVSVTIDGPDGTEALGSLTHAGDLTAAGLTEGETYRVTATAEDDACLADGTPAHNVSAATTPIDVTIAKSGGTDDEARRLAKEAMDAADATGQHFWSDGSGAHVSTQPGNAAGASNVLINALGILLRAAQTNLLGVTPSGITIYDGNGNSTGNVVATFTDKSIELGKKSTSAVIKFCGDLGEMGLLTDAETAFSPSFGLHSEAEPITLLYSHTVADGDLEGGSRTAGSFPTGTKIDSSVAVGQADDYGGGEAAIMSIAVAPDGKHRAWGSVDLLSGFSDSTGTASPSTLAPRISVSGGTSDGSTTSSFGGEYPLENLAHVLSKTVLYNGGSALAYDTAPGAGTTGTVTLSETAANFKELTIFFSTEQYGALSSISVSHPDGRNVSMFCCTTASGTMVVTGSVASISGSSIAPVSGGHGTTWLWPDQRPTVSTSGNPISVVRVEGRR